MKPKFNILLDLSLYIGLTALIGGCLIFLVWIGGRYLFALDVKIAVAAGFIWTITSFCVALIGLFLLFLYSLINWRSLHLRILLAGGSLLVNLPVVFLIIFIVSDLESKTFVRLKNHTDKNIEVELHGSFKSWEIGKIRRGSSTVFNYNPPYWNNDGRLYQKPDTLFLLLHHATGKDTVAFPILEMGTCKHLIIDKDLVIHPSSSFLQTADDL